MRNIWRFSISMLISIALLWLSLHQINFQTLQQSILHLHATDLLMYMLSLALLQYCRAWRWWILMRSHTNLSFTQALSISNIGNMFLVLLPLRLGELTRPYLMRQTFAMSMSTSLAAVAVERIADGLSISLLFFVTVQSLTHSIQLPWILYWGGMLTLLVFSAALVVVLVALYAYPWLCQKIDQLSKFGGTKTTQRLQRSLAAFRQGLLAVPNQNTLSWVVFWTFAYWLVSAAGLWYLAKSFALTISLPMSLVVVCVLVVGIMIPSGPGMLGTYQAAIMTSLQMFGVPASAAATYALFAYVINMLVVVGFGLPPMLRQKNHSWQQAWRKQVE